MTRMSERGLLALLLLVTAAYALAEELTLVTYYPSPRGVYNELRVGGGNVSTPAGKLNVVQEDPAFTAAPAFRVDDRTPPDDTPFVIDREGNVGIGTNTPDANAKLEVAGQLKITGGAPGANKLLTSDSTGLSSWRASSDLGLVMGAGTPNTLVRWADATTVESTADPTLSVGIGTESPQAHLDVMAGYPQLRVGTSPAVNGGDQDLVIYMDYTGPGQRKWRLGVRSNSSGVMAPLGSFYIMDDSSDIYHPRITFTPDGNVGIGTANPTSRLHVDGKGTFTGGVDPPYVSFTEESHGSIREFAKTVEAHEKVMQFFNKDTHRLELYVIGEDRFYTLSGEPIAD